MIHEGQVKKYYELVETCAQKLQRNRRTTMCAVLAKCTFHKLKRSWPRTTSRRLGSYSTFSTNACNLKPTSSVDTHSQQDKTTTSKLDNVPRTNSLQLWAYSCLWEGITF